MQYVVAHTLHDNVFENFYQIYHLPAQPSYERIIVSRANELELGANTKKDTQQFVLNYREQGKIYVYGKRTVVKSMFILVESLSGRIAFFCRDFAYVGIKQ